MIYCAGLELYALSSPTGTRYTHGIIEQAESLLQSLKSPPRYELSRKRKIQTQKLPAWCKQHKPGTVNHTGPKSITAASRVEEFPD